MAGCVRVDCALFLRYLIAVRPLCIITRSTATASFDQQSCYCCCFCWCYHLGVPLQQPRWVSRESTTVASAKYDDVRPKKQKSTAENSVVKQSKTLHCKEGVLKKSIKAPTSPKCFLRFPSIKSDPNRAARVWRVRRRCCRVATFIWSHGL